MLLLMKMFLKELAVYNVEESRLFNDFSGIYIWAKYNDENYPELKGTEKNKQEAKKAYARVIELYENEKVRKSVKNKNRYNNAKKRNNSL